MENKKYYRVKDILSIRYKQRGEFVKNDGEDYIQLKFPDGGHFNYHKDWLTEVIDMTPTWSSLVPIFITVFEEHCRKSSITSTQAINLNTRNIEDMAQAADLAVEYQKLLNEIVTIMGENGRAMDKLAKIREILKKYYEDNKVSHERKPEAIN